MFVRLLGQMFSGYRSCLTLIRIHPKPVITFNKVKSLSIFFFFLWNCAVTVVVKGKLSVMTQNPYLDPQ